MAGMSRLPTSVSLFTYLSLCDDFQSPDSPDGVEVWDGVAGIRLELALPSCCVRLGD